MDITLPKSKTPLSKKKQANPFTFGNPISEPDKFFGRKAEIRQVVNRLLSGAHESTSLTGERRIGKTSLLLYLSNPAVADSLGLAKEKFCLVYVDFQGLTDITPHRFWQRVLAKIGHSVCEGSLSAPILEFSQRTNFDLFDLEDQFEQINSKGIAVVLLMDEFEYVTQNPNFKADFFGGLRSLAIHHGLALIPSTRRELVDLCHSEEIKGSPFFNIFANVVLRPFSNAEVDELIEGYMKGSSLSFSQSDKEFIFQIAGSHPFFVQMASHYLFEAKTQDLNGEALSIFASGNFNIQADAHFNYLWSHCTESEKITLLVVLTLSLQKPTKHTIPTLENLSRLRTRAPMDITELCKRGLIVENQQQFLIFSPSFASWIKREIVVAPGEEESISTAEEWLKSGGHEATAKKARELFPKFKKKYWPYIASLVTNLGYEVAANAFVLLIGLAH